MWQDWTKKIINCRGDSADNRVGLDSSCKALNFHSRVTISEWTEWRRSLCDHSAVHIGNFRWQVNKFFIAFSNFNDEIISQNPRKARISLRVFCGDWNSIRLRLWHFLQVSSSAIHLCSDFNSLPDWDEFPSRLGALFCQNQWERGKLRQKFNFWRIWKIFNSTASWKFVEILQGRETRRFRWKNPKWISKHSIACQQSWWSRKSQS